MASEENRALTAAEMEEIAEYERIVEFADQVLSGTHPRVKIPPHLLAQAQAQVQPAATTSAPVLFAATPPSLPAQSHRADLINYNHDYYKDLGVQSHVPVDSINRAFKSKSDLYNPTTGQVKWKWTSPNPSHVRTIQEQWERALKAYLILTNPNLREKYDAGRSTAALLAVPVTPAKKLTNKRHANSAPIMQDNQAILARKREYETKRAAAGEDDEDDREAEDGDSTKAVIGG